MLRSKRQTAKCSLAFAGFGYCPSALCLKEKRLSDWAGAFALARAVGLKLGTVTFTLRAYCLAFSCIFLQLHQPQRK